MARPQDGISTLEVRFRERLRVEKMEIDFENIIKEREVLEKQNEKLRKEVKKLQKKCKKK